MSQFKQRPAYQCQKCKAIILTESGMDRHAEKCKFHEPEIEGQVMLDGCSQQDEGDALRGAT